MLTTKTQNALRFLLALAELPLGTLRSLKDITDAKELPHAYLEQILPFLIRADLIQAKRGAYGGYSLKRAPESIKVWDVVSAVEHHLDQTACHGLSDCKNKSHGGDCDLHQFLSSVNQHMKQYFQSVSLKDIQSKTNTIVFLKRS
jgi:Rrf2 family iron-sulfur cluster assembly transcriptional regulator